MNLRKSVLGLAGLLTVSSCAPDARGSSADGERIDMLEKAALSFSALPFGSTEIPNGARLIEQKSAPDCQPEGNLSDCTYVATDGVEHHYFGQLILKSILVDRLTQSPIEALGIGSTRGEVAIVERATQFLDGVPADCEDVREEFETGIDTVCTFTLGDGWVMLQFFEDRLILAEVSAGQV